MVPGPGPDLGDLVPAGVDVAPAGVAEGHVRVRLQQPHLVLEGVVGEQEVVSGDDDQVAAPARLRALHQRAHEPLVPLVPDQADARVGEVGADHVHRVVRGAVVDEDQLEVGERLPQDRLDAPRQEARVVVVQDRHREQGARQDHSSQASKAPRSAAANRRSLSNRVMKVRPMVPAGRVSAACA